MPTAVTEQDVRAGIRELGLSRAPVCAHASLKSFGRVDGGADAVVDAFLAEDCTLIVPTFSSTFAVPPPESMRPARNGFDYDAAEARSAGSRSAFTRDSVELDRDMGAIAAAVVARDGRVRGDHPLDSFSAVGPGSDLVAEQRPLDVYAPLRILGARGGFVLLIGVGLARLTLIHLAEEKAGRKLFRRWANGPDGLPMEVEVGGCSEGFGALEPMLAPFAREAIVGDSTWRAYPAKDAADAAADAIREQPEITKCGDPGCLRCADAVAGGPVPPRG